MTKGAHLGVRPSVLSGLFITVVLAFLAHPGPARAQVAGGAASYFRRAQAEMSAGDPEAAARDFLAAYREEPSAKTLLAAAMAYEKAGDALAARAYYWWYLNSGAASTEEQEWLFPRIVALSNPAKPKAEARPSPQPEPTPQPGAQPSPPPKPEPQPTPQPKPEPSPQPQPSPLPPSTEAEPHPVRPRHEATPPAPAPRPAPAPTTPPPETGTTHAHWYGLPMLIAEPIAIALVVGGHSGGNDNVTTVGVLGMIAISPIIHGANGHGARGWGGFFARGAGAAIGGASGGPEGAIVGYSAAALLDAFFFTREDLADDADGSGVAPTVSFGAGGASFGVAGRF